MATNLVFEKREGAKEFCTISPVGDAVVQIHREDNGYFTVYASIAGMEPVAVYNELWDKDLIFEVEGKEGVTFTLESGVHVLQANMVSE